MNRILSIALILATLAGGCSLVPEITGVWRTQEGVTVTWPALDFEGRVELVVGQYGHDVAGMLRLFQDGKEFKDNYLFGPCPCLFLEAASFDDSALVFDVILCGDDAAEWSGRFEWREEDSGEILTGALEPRNPGGAGGDDIATAEFVLVYAGGKKLIKEDELNQECPEQSQ